ncbi:hypothetical protein Avbf_07835 [Armadillidium vulgare]|nr:hypothetical protein Avbf_07835 [Armadillidium vulgare]
MSDDESAYSIIFLSFQRCRVSFDLGSKMRFSSCLEEDILLTTNREEYEEEDVHGVRDEGRSDREDDDKRYYQNKPIEIFY